MSHRDRARRHFLSGAVYATVVYLSVVVLLWEDRTDPEDAAAILVGTAVVFFWVAHIYSHLAPRIAKEGRRRRGLLRETAEDRRSSRWKRSPRRSPPWLT